MAIPTLADFPELARPLLVHPDDEFVAHSLVRCPCCGRATPADTVVDVRALPGTVIRGGNHQAERDHEWLCDGGLHLVYHHQPSGWTRSKVYRAIGASAESIREHRARELAHEERRRDYAAGRAHNEGEAFDRALATLPRGRRDLPGTEPPARSPEGR